MERRGSRQPQDCDGKRERAGLAHFLLSGAPVSRSRTTDRFSAKDVAYDPEGKRLFHSHARYQLLALAAALGFAPYAFDLRSNQGGTAVSARSRSKRTVFISGEPVREGLRFRDPIPLVPKADAITGAASITSRRSARRA